MSYRATGLRLSCLSLVVTGLASVAGAVAPLPGQVIAYGVDNDGGLFSFDPALPAVVTNIGFVSPVPEAIDFRPGTGELYGVDVGPNTTTLYKINTSTAAATAIGAGFPSTGAGYDLTGNNQVGFDFNPTTLQGDGSIRIRLVSNNSRANLRLNSDTGTVAAVDTNLAFAGGTGTPFVDSSAYINSAQSTAGGATTLYGLDMRVDSLVTQNPPNVGTINVVGPFGVTIDGNAPSAFDIASLNPADATTLDEVALAVFRRTGVSDGAYLLYDVNLDNGATTGGRLVGTGVNFDGGLAVRVVPEPASLAIVGAAALLTLRRRR